MGRGGGEEQALGTVAARAARRPGANLPLERKGQRGTRDVGTEGWRRRGKKLHMRRDFSELTKNPSEGGKRRWPLFDSMGRKLCYIEQHSNGWQMRDPRSNKLLYSDRSLDSDQLEIQGEASMESAHAERGMALIKFRANDRSTLAPGQSVVPFGLAAFIPRQALPATNERRQAIRADVGRYRTGAGSSRLTPLRTITLASPGFSSDEKFVGTDGIERSYATYDAKNPYRGAQYIMVNTTGVKGGGVVRAVARAGDQFEVLDEMPRPDRNALGAFGARWIYGRLAGTRIHGWIPLREPLS